MDEPPGGSLSSSIIGIYGALIRRLRGITNHTVNKEPKWRHPRDQLTTGYVPETLRQPRHPVTPSTQDKGITMATLTAPAAPAGTKQTAIIKAPTQAAPKPGDPPSDPNLVEMSWDPITRIVGSLGIYTKIDFAKKKVVECHSTSSIFRGYSIFMKNKDPRDSHFITSRICGICGDNHATCSVYAQNMAYGIKPPPLAEWIVNLGEAAEYMFDHNIFQDNLVGVDFCEMMVKETNPGVWEQGPADRGPACQGPRLPDHRGYHAVAESVRGRVLPRDAADEPHDAGDVLPDGGPPRPSLDPLPRGRRHRPVDPALHRLPGPPAALRRVHEEGRAAP